MKKIVAFLICTIMILMSFSMSVSALDSVTIEQVFTKLPEITATLKFKTEKKESIDKTDFSANLGGESLNVTSFDKYDKNEHTSTIYVLVDTSGSISNRAYKEIKRKLVAFSDGLTSNEKLVLISFGEKVKTVLKGDESKSTRKNKINSLPTEESETNLFNAVKHAVEMSQSDTATPTDRSYAIVISDGENFETDGGNTLKEVENSVAGHGLPIYALCVEGSSSNSSEFGSFARASGGGIFTADSTSKVGSSFDDLISDTKNVYILSMLTKSNNPSDGSTRNLMIRAKDKSANLDIKSTRWVKDDEAPVITKVESFENEDGVMQVKVFYSENVLNADKAENFKLTRKEGKKEYLFEEAEYVFTTNEYYSILTPKKEIANRDDYSFVIENVTDSANEQNAIYTEGSVYEVGMRSAFVVFLANYWWIFIVLLAVAGGVVALVLILKSQKAKKAAEEIQNAYNAGASFVPQNEFEYQYEYDASPVIQREKHHIMAPNGKNITLKIICNKSVERVVNTTVIDKITVGRSEKCDVYLDDMKMSRVHFEIINQNGEFFVNDLNSVNGTLINKMRISAKRKLNPNDEIIAGHSKFRVIF